jgi:hypothetical protein
MSERYWITGVQLEMLIAVESMKGRKDIAGGIIDKQFLGDKENMKGVNASDIIDDVCDYYYEHDNENPVILDLRDKLKKRIEGK